jgi:hypothetical protein
MEALSLLGLPRETRVSEADRTHHTIEHRALADRAVLLISHKPEHVAADMVAELSSPAARRRPWRLRRGLPKLVRRRRITRASSVPDW